ncbi:MAG: YhcH/YjgK/YiaL family protein [Microbacter sp.]
MIVADLKDAAFYEMMHPLFKQAFDYIRQHDVDQLPTGKTELNGDRLLLTVAEMQGKDRSLAMIETHQQYIDIQMPILGVETIGWRAGVDCHVVSKVYDADNDIAFFEDQPTAFITLHPGQFVIFFPHDGHAPGISDKAIRKIIFKVKI